MKRLFYCAGLFDLMTKNRLLSDLAGNHVQ